MEFVYGWLCSLQIEFISGEFKTKFLVGYVLRTNKGMNKTKQNKNKK